MEFKRCKKIFLIVALTAFIVLLFNSNTVLGAINKEYSTFDTVTDEELTDAFKNSDILELLAKLIYAVGRFLEWILATIFKMLTGSEDFPWADKIVFNAVPLLDVNFINPGGKVNGIDYAPRTFVGQEAIQSVLKNTYATVLTLAASFFGIVVLITAIKLVISTIASDKAKYKQAIVDWLVGFITLFCIHYAISFIFYLNEELVKVASRIVVENLTDVNAQVIEVAKDTVIQELIDNAEASGATYNGKLVSAIFEENTQVVLTWQNKLKWGEKTYGVTEAFMKDVGFLNKDWLKGKKEQYERLGMLVSWAADKSITVEKIEEVRNSIKLYIYPGDILNAAQAISPDKFNDLFGKYADDAKEYLQIVDKHLRNAWQATNTPSGANKNNISSVVYGDNGDIYGTYSFAITADGYLDIKNNTYHKWDGKKTTNSYYLSSGSGDLGLDVADGTVTNYYWTTLIDELKSLKQSGSGGEVGNSKGVRLIADLAEYFRYNSYSKETRPLNVTGIKNAKEIRIQNMIMYAILVAQSLILFISYVKRLFYVILLAMMAPIVVVFDFFQKFGK